MAGSFSSLRLRRLICTSIVRSCAPPPPPASASRETLTFGVAPSLLAYLWGFRMMPELANPQLRGQILHLGVLVCFIFLICGASRLARFNISINPQPRNPGRPGKKYFVGMPIPGAPG